MTAVVVGNGVQGLTCAIRLAERGFNVHVVAAGTAEYTTSSGAGGIWEWPPFEVEPADKAGRWAIATLNELCRLHHAAATTAGTAAAASTVGIRFYDIHYCYPHGMSAARAKSWMDSGVGPLLDAALHGGRSGNALRPELGSMADVPAFGSEDKAVNKARGVGERGHAAQEVLDEPAAPRRHTRYSYGAPVVYMKRYLRYLHERCLQNAVTFHRAHVGSLATAVDLVLLHLNSTAVRGGKTTPSSSKGNSKGNGRNSSSRRGHDTGCDNDDANNAGGMLARATVVINCTGLGAATLSDVMDETMTPRRGVLVYLKSPAVSFVCSNEEDTAPNITYMVPQPGGIVACGGLSEPHDIPDATAFSIPIAVAGSQDSTATATAPITAAEEAAVIRRCTRLVPALNGAEVVKRWAGLRPGRRDGVRLERGATDVQIETRIGPDACGARSAGGCCGGNDATGGDIKSSTLAPIPVVHCYGHGGSGVTLSWGCAVDVVAFAVEALEERGIEVGSGRKEVAIDHSKL